MWIRVFVGLLFVRTWGSFGLGATLAVVNGSTEPDHLALGFASTEALRRVGYLLGPLLATVVLAGTAAFLAGFRATLLLAVGFGVVVTVAQHRPYDASGDTVGGSVPGLSAVVDDLGGLPPTLRPLLVADTLVRFANHMVYVFFVVVTDFLEAGFTGFGVDLSPAAFLGVLLGVEMTVAVLTMAPVSKLGESTGRNPSSASASSSTPRSPSC